MPKICNPGDNTNMNFMDLRNIEEELEIIATPHKVGSPIYYIPDIEH